MREWLVELLTVSAMALAGTALGEAVTYPLGLPFRWPIFLAVWLVSVAIYYAAFRPFNPWPKRHEPPPAPAANENRRAPR